MYQIHWYWRRRGSNTICVDKLSTRVCCRLSTPWWTRHLLKSLFSCTHTIYNTAKNVKRSLKTQVVRKREQLHCDIRGRVRYQIVLNATIKATVVVHFSFPERFRCPFLRVAPVFNTRIWEDLQFKSCSIGKPSMVALSRTIKVQ